LLNDKFLISNVKLNPKSQIPNDNRLKIFSGDILDFDMEDKRYQLTAKSYKLVANIPYYITGAVLEKFLSAEHKPELIVLLVQKEVAERICAQKGEMSLLSISVQYYGQPEIVDIVKSSSFFPEPKVDSAILKIKTKNQKPKNSDKDFFKVVKVGFRARRKTLFNNLKSGTNLNSGQIEQILAKMGLDKNIRAQELSVARWQELADKIKS